MVPVLVAVVAKTLAWEAAMEMLDSDLLVDVGIALAFPLPILYSVDMLSDTAIGVFKDISADVRLGVPCGTIFEGVFAGVNANVFAAATALKFPMRSLLGEFSGCAG